LKKILLGLVLVSSLARGQAPLHYEVSFPNRVHHEAEVELTVSSLSESPLELRMSRSSPGRYALHEFAKNVYDVKAFGEDGRELIITRSNPHQWNVIHNGWAIITYTIFGDQGDGTYVQFDETHAHMNIPATFMYPVNYGDRAVEISIKIPEDSGWKIATQLKDLGDDTFHAPNLYYFMDSPIEVSNFMLREQEMESNGSTYNIRLALHHNGTPEEADEYFTRIMKVVNQEVKVYGQLPNFDFGEYTFLACYIPNADGDGMEHRNSTIITSTRALADGGMERNIGTVSHEFFHAWNVERIRPRSLEPFDFGRANMSGELWFAEGFTSYYTGLILSRAGLRTQKQYIEGLDGTLNYVLNSPGRALFGPVEMSYQAPFVDAAESVDQSNFNNTFISYYSYGSALGLALDLTLRQMDDKDLDGYMRMVWNQYGRDEKPYNVEDLQQVLAQYANSSIADNFFSSFVYGQGAPDYNALLRSVGVSFERADPTVPRFGINVQKVDGGFEIASNVTKGSAAYEAGLEREDILVQIDGMALAEMEELGEAMTNYKAGDGIEVTFFRLGSERSTTVILGENPDYETQVLEDTGTKPTRSQLRRREEWLGKK